MRSHGARGRMAIKRSRKPKDAKQSKRFVDTARELEVDESGKAFERALGAVLPTPKATRSRPSGKKSSR